MTSWVLCPLCVAGTCGRNSRLGYTPCQSVNTAIVVIFAIPALHLHLLTIKIKARRGQNPGSVVQYWIQRVFRISWVGYFRPPHEVVSPAIVRINTPGTAGD